MAWSYPESHVTYNQLERGLSRYSEMIARLETAEIQRYSRNLISFYCQNLTEQLGVTD